MSGLGDDVNPCSRTAPCKTFAGAISKTAAGGEINVLDSGGFGAVTITKSITIDGGGAMASILASATTGIIINIAETDAAKTVRLRRLSINGAPPSSAGVQGIRVISAGRVFVEDTVIDGFTKFGITVETAAATQVFIENTTVRNNAGGGINVVSGGNQVVIRDSNVVGNGFGLFAEKSELTVVGCVVAHNATGIHAGAGSTVRISDVAVVNNAVGLTAAGGAIVSFRNNVIHGNRKDGEPTQPGAPR
ncbi:MAG: right-handed parallel beta-helix repeat-containing protein [Pyrinomonadaceae bacterium]